MKAISFWEMITSLNNNICIPKIQRDYAQGRIGKELLRQRLLMRCKEALEDPTQYFLLDFVYGSKDDSNKYYPLDGQQRLTTLWLLHWYIAFMANELNEEVRNYLSNFSYETRRSSSDFCKFLCQLKYTPEVSSSTDLRSYISSQTKFSAKWMLDPTISAMLNTLCGTNISDDNNNDIKDGLAEIFVGCDETAFKNYFSILKSSDCPIKFYNLDMRGENLPLSDDLYIKMNARGKQLSDWENFKADLLSFVDNKDELGAEIDGCWTDLFWHKQSGGQIDAILFAFINRYIFNEFMCENIKGPLTKYSLYDLYGFGGNDTTLRYEDFSRYTNDISARITKEAIVKLQHLMKQLAEFQRQYKQDFDDLNNTIASGWTPKSNDESSSDNFKFIPTYESSNISKINLNQRLVFLAVCRYFENVDIDYFDKDNLKDWVRFAWNISEYIRTDAMSNAFNLINEKSEYCNDIIQHLSTSTIDDKSFASEQIKEEIEKAQYILNNPNKKDDILTAERFRDLHGHIGFLFHDDNGVVLWEKFDDKFKRLKELFATTQKETEEKFKRENILKTFLSYCNKDNQIRSWTNNYCYIYDCLWEHWKANFSNKRYVTPTHMILTNQNAKDYSIAIDLFEQGCNRQKAIYKILLETDLLEQVAVDLKGSYLREYGGKLCLYPSAEGINLESELRDKILKELKDQNKVQLGEGVIIYQTPSRLFCKGWDIEFIYQDYHFKWHRDNKIISPMVNDNALIEEDCSSEDVLKVLDNLIIKHNAICKH